MRISDWSSDVCSSDLDSQRRSIGAGVVLQLIWPLDLPVAGTPISPGCDISERRNRRVSMESHTAREGDDMNEATTVTRTQVRDPICGMDVDPATAAYRVEHDGRSEEHTSELQSLMRISYAVFLLT